MKLQFRNVKSDKIKDSFQKALQAFDDLHDYPIILKQKRVKSSTMQAQPIISLRSLWSGVKKYHISLGVYVSSSDTLKVADVPEEVLTGWFAHELGHLVDYLHHSNFNMIVYGLKYMISDSFKMKAEHEADYIAIKNGFKEEIIATKKWLLTHQMIDEKYKNHLHKYYLSIEQVELCNLNEPPFKPILE